MRRPLADGDPKKRASGRLDASGRDPERRLLYGTVLPYLAKTTSSIDSMQYSFIEKMGKGANSGNLQRELLLAVDEHRSVVRPESPWHKATSPQSNF